MPQTYPMMWNMLIIMMFLNMKNISIFSYEPPMKMKNINLMTMKITQWSW